MKDETLFELPERGVGKVEVPTRRGAARVVRPVRSQVEWVSREVDALIGEDHPARTIWGFLERLDLSQFYGAIKAVLDRPGRPATDPQLLLGLWLLASADGVGSARRLARLCEEHDAYRWMCGGVSVNYHMLADFRVAHRAALDDLLSKILAALMQGGLIEVQQVAQDGVRIRASAGKGSFRGKDGLQRHLQAARAQVERLAEQRERPDPHQRERAARARERAAREREERLTRALAALPELEAIKERTAARRGKGTPVGEAQASSTDPDARVMRMADGGFRPAYNVQLSSTVGTGIVVGVAATNVGADAGQAGPMMAQVIARTDRKPEAAMFDGGFVNRAEITDLERQGIAVYAPLRPSRRADGTRAPLRPSAGDTPEVAAWHARMGTAEGKEIYKQRAATAEWVNAQLHQRHHLTQFTVRGLDKVLCVVLLAVITHDLLRWAALTAPA